MFLDKYEIIRENLTLVVLLSSCYPIKNVRSKSTLQVFYPEINPDALESLQFAHNIYLFWRQYLICLGSS